MRTARQCRRADRRCGRKRPGGRLLTVYGEPLRYVIQAVNRYSKRPNCGRHGGRDLLYHR